MKKRIRFLSLVAALLGLLLVLWGCGDVSTLTALKNAEGTPGSTGATSANKRHVYIGGSVGTSSTNTVPVYWKDGNLNYLPLNGNAGGWTDAIVQDSSGNIYVVGGRWNQSGSQIGYWKNSTFVPLPLGTYSTAWEANIAVDTTGNVWVLGGQGSAGPYTVLFWENSQGPNLLPGTPYQCFGLGADGSGNVYFVGVESISGSIVPASWKNGANPIAMALSTGTAGAWPASHLATDSSGNLYICGRQDGGTSPGPVYWKTVSEVWQSPIPLSIGGYSLLGSFSLCGLAIDSSGNLRFLGCWGPSGIFTLLLYWQSATSNPTVISLPNGTSVFNPGTPTFDTGGNFIFAGQAGNTQPGGNWATITDGVPVYWENGSPIILPMGVGNTWGSANKVVVGP